LKAQSVLANSRSHIHELARALQAYVAAKGHFPRGALERSPTAEHPQEDWAPDLRLSWMVELLPYVGEGDFQDVSGDPNKSWNEGKNLQLAQMVVPQFLAPGAANTATLYHIRYPGMAQPVAATNFVGIGGVGRDSASYTANDPAAAKKRGIFGYDRETRPEEIKDGLDQTIALIQVPAEPRSPWLAGGGSTVRGVSEDLDSVEPFVCTEYQGQKGTFAIMADFKVRFIPATIDPATFRAMCTIAGGDKIANLDKVAPEVQADDEPAAKKKADATPAPDAPGGVRPASATSAPKVTKPEAPK
jgi:hypothetical protein